MMVWSSETSTCTLRMRLIARSNWRTLHKSSYSSADFMDAISDTSFSTFLSAGELNSATLNTACNSESRIEGTGVLGDRKKGEIDADKGGRYVGTTVVDDVMGVVNGEGDEGNAGEGEVSSSIEAGDAESTGSTFVCLAMKWRFNPPDQDWN